MLRIENLRVNIGEKEILHDINLEIEEGEIHVLFGPNGSGKTTLLMTIMGFPNYRVLEGKIFLKGEDITHLPPHERAKRGIGISFQRPPTIRGLKTRKMAELANLCSDETANIDEIASNLNLEGFLDRDINYGFSGGELKRTELLQLLAQNPDLVLLDEPESGVDLENIALIGEAINCLLEKDISCKERRLRPKKSSLIISHTGYILDYVNADKGYVMCEGSIGCSGQPHELLDTIRKLGYEECIACQLQIPI